MTEEPGVKRYVALARVSSREQEKEGFSLDVQEDALRAYAEKEGGRIVKLWRIAETATKAEQRTSFREMLAYAKQHAGQLNGLLVYKVDRAARNMSDYGKLEELESVFGLQLIATSQHTQDNPAGRMARRMLASMAAFFTEQLALDVKDGLARRVRDGWFPTVAPYGYRTERVDGRSIVKIDLTEADHVRRIFHLYAFEHCTLDMVIAKLNAEGRTYTQKQPHWQRSKVHRILRDRSYIGDLRYHDAWQPGRHEPLIDSDTFQRVQKLLGDKIYKAHELTYAGELITCGHCGRPITGEIVVKKPSGKRATSTIAVRDTQRRTIRASGCARKRSTSRSSRCSTAFVSQSRCRRCSRRRWSRGPRITSNNLAPVRGTSNANSMTCAASRSVC